jgi:hypothetical protein
MKIVDKSSKQKITTTVSRRPRAIRSRDPWPNPVQLPNAMILIIRPSASSEAVLSQQLDSSWSDQPLVCAKIGSVMSRDGPGLKPVPFATPSCRQRMLDCPTPSAGDGTVHEKAMASSRCRSPGERSMMGIKGDNEPSQVVFRIHSPSRLHSLIYPNNQQTLAQLIA